MKQVGGGATRRPPRLRGRAAATTIGLLLLAGCGGGGGSAPPMPVGPGVTSTTITLGVLTDLTGPDAAFGTTVTEGAQLFWQHQNSAGGVCGRSVTLLPKDHQGDAQTAAKLYSELRTRVLALQQLLGSAEISSLLGAITHDGMPTLPVSWSSKLLATPELVITGTTYDLQMINAVDWLLRTRGLQAGGTIGDIYLDGPAGTNALVGVTVAAARNHLRVVAEPIQATDKDLTTQVQAIRKSGARDVLLATTPLQAASAVSVAEAAGYDATFVGTSSTFTPALLDGPARTAMEKRFYVVQSVSPFSGDGAGPALVRDAYDTTYPGRAMVDAGVDLGYGQGKVMYQILRAACAAGSLERPALFTALRTLSSVDTGGLIAPLDYSRSGQPPARATLVLRPDDVVRGGLAVVEPLTVSAAARAYSCPC